MARLLLFLSFLVTSSIMLWLTTIDKMSEGYLTIYLGAFVTTYATSRRADYINRATDSTRTDKDSDE